ncbi:MAG: hypothetical protein HGA90_04695 [Alphaproteobacteria bacterium]|nr:hypothetical protein [Alphaproteobacteria bacterium]
MKTKTLLGLAFVCVFILLALLRASSAQAALTAQGEGDGSCNPYPDISVTVMPVFEAPKSNTSTNLAALQNLSRSGLPKIPHYESVALGITSYAPVLEFYAPIIQHLMPDGSFCARVQHLDARIGYKDVTVYVASEFSPGSCSYQEILAHEQKHIEVNRQLLQEYAPLIKQKLTSFLKLNGMFIVPNGAYANKLLREKVTAVIQEVSLRMLEENKKRQKLIDSPEEYARTKTACQGQITRIVQSTMARR